MRAIMTVPERTFAKRRRDSEMGTAISEMILMGSQMGSQGGRGEHLSAQSCLGLENLTSL